MLLLLTFAVAVDINLFSAKFLLSSFEIFRLHRPLQLQPQEQEIGQCDDSIDILAILDTTLQSFYTSDRPPRTPPDGEAMATDLTVRAVLLDIGMPAFFFFLTRFLSLAR